MRYTLSMAIDLTSVVTGPDSIGVLARTKTLRVTLPESRAARTYHVAVRDGDGCLWLGNKGYPSFTAALMKSISISKSEGPPSTWDRDTLTSHYKKVQP